MNIVFQVLKSKTGFYIYIFIITFLVILPLNNVKELNNISIINIRGDYFFHTILFIPWAFFNLAIKKNIGLWFFFGLFFASGSEIVQYFLSYRSYNINDQLANTLGVVFGFLLWNAVKRFWTFKS